MVDRSAPSITILQGDSLAVLRTLPSAFFDCVVTSPPYWGLRDYQTGRWEGGDPNCNHRSSTMQDGRNENRPVLAGSVATNRDQLLLAHRSVCGRCGARKIDQQIGLEPTLGEHLQVMVEVFREVRRVLKAHGTCWLNYGDCYAAAPNGKSAAAYKADGIDDRTFRDKPFSTVGPILQPDTRGQQRASAKEGYRSDSGCTVRPGGFLKPKDLCMLPNRLAIALQDDGWWVRSEIIWHKPNPMPESTYDRPTSAHEKVWLLTKSEEYFYNHEAIREPVTGGSHARASGPHSREKKDRVPLSRKIKVPGGWDTKPGADGTINRSGRTEAEYVQRIPGVTPKSAPEGSNVKAKGSFLASVTQLVETRNARNVWTIAPRAYREAHFATFPPALAERCMKAGVPLLSCSFCGNTLPQPTCHGACQVIPPVPGRVLDPFGGAGTVGLVAQKLGVEATLIELNPEYVEMTKRRLGLLIAEAAE